MKKINIAELLKDCPKGMELDCTIFDDVYFDYIDDVSDIINCYIQDSTKKIGISFSKYGCYSSISKSKCVIFPKGKTTWEGFQRPFKDGDIVTYKDENKLVAMILNKFVNFVEVHYHCALYDNAKGFVTNNYIVGEPKYTHLATEEEKTKLFQAIKANGYKWNPETKTLEKLVEPKFKDGDVCYIKTKYHEHIFIFKVNEDYKHIQEYVNLCENHFCTGKYPVCTIDDVKEIRFATKEEKKKLFDAIKEHGYNWNTETKTLEELIEPRFKVGDMIQDVDEYKVRITEVNLEDECYGYESMIAKGIGGIAFSEQDNWKLVPNKFDINTLKPFKSEVLVRNFESDYWKPAIFGFAGKVKDAPFCVEGGNFFNKCIPYEGNEHLLGTKNDCDEFYKTWEE